MTFKALNHLQKGMTQYQPHAGDVIMIVMQTQQTTLQRSKLFSRHFLPLRSAVSSIRKLLPIFNKQTEKKTEKKTIPLRPISPQTDAYLMGTLMSNIPPGERASAGSLPKSGALAPGPMHLACFPCFSSTLFLRSAYGIDRF